MSLSFTLSPPPHTHFTYVLLTWKSQIISCSHQFGVHVSSTISIYARKEWRKRDITSPAANFLESCVCMNKDVTVPSWTESVPQAGSHHDWQQRQHSAFLGQKNSCGFKAHLVELPNCCSEAVGPRVVAPLPLCLISCNLIDFLPSYHFPSQRQRCRQKRSAVAVQRCSWEEHIIYGALICGVWEKNQFILLGP